MVHSYYLNGYYIALDVNSGAVHVLDKTAFDVLNCISEQDMGEQTPAELYEKLPQYSKNEIDEAFAEFYALYKDEQLFSKDDYIDIQKLALGKSPIKALCLNIAHDCNLRCEYCFASTGEYGHNRELMPLEVAKAAIDFLIANSASRHNLEVDFFGGEPLMNLDVVKATVAYARSIEKEHNKNFRFTLTTNGVLLNDDTMDFLNKEMSNVVLSIDGRKEVNDRVRVRRDGTGIYDNIVPKFQKLAESRGQDMYYVRGTYTKYNLDFAEDVLHLASLGFKQTSVEPVVATPDMPYAITEEDLPKIYEQYEKLAKEMLRADKEGRHFNFFHFNIDLEQGPCAIKRLRGCGSGNEYIAITPNGDIYPCHQFVGNEDFIMGNVKTGEFNTEMKAKFASANVYTREGCRDCFAKFYCSGGCSANNINFNGDIMKPYKVGCETEKKRVECAIMMKAAKMLEQ